MIINLKASNLKEIKNPAFRAYANIYIDIYQDFIEQIRRSGIEFDLEDDAVLVGRRLQELEGQGAELRNDSKSVFINEISSACEACKQGIGSATFFISLQCHRSCFYCFNPNQEKYQYYQTHTRELDHELDELRQQNKKLNHIALTGGEPLLHKQKAVDFFQQAQEKFPGTYTRLYTCGDHVDQETLEELQEAGLQEIRFSIRMDDLRKGQKSFYDRITLARNYLPQVVVEMPVLPGTLEEMKEVLVELDRIGLNSINLLEFCYPLINADVFNRKGFKLKRYPFRVLYNYWYAGGLPIAKSELVCLDLLEFALNEGLSLGVHYCSVENKHTGQIYQQNYGKELPPTAFFSERDYFIKTAKVFGEDIQPVRELLTHLYQEPDLVENQEHDYLEFHVEKIPSLGSLNIEVGISSQVFEQRNGETYLRELKVDLTTPQKFSIKEI